MFFFGLKEFQGCFAPMWNRVQDQQGRRLPVPERRRRQRVPRRLRAADQGVRLQGRRRRRLHRRHHRLHLDDLHVQEQALPSCSATARCRRTSTRSGSRPSQQGFKPKLATVAKVLLFPADTVALGALVNNIATDSWWGPYMPYTSSLTGQTRQGARRRLHRPRPASSGCSRSAPRYSLFEVAQGGVHARPATRTTRPRSPAPCTTSTTPACAAPLNFANGPAPGVGIINPVGVQWKKGTGKFPFEMRSWTTR